MNQSENQLLTRVGPETPMGNFLRQYWIPVLQSADSPENDGAPLRMRLLCENLVAFRNTDGQIGLMVKHSQPNLILTDNTDLLAAEKLSNGTRPVLTLDQIGACPLL
jgi:hypothetical protein